MLKDFQGQEGTELASKINCVIDEHEETCKLTNNYKKNRKARF